MNPNVQYVAKYELDMAKDKSNRVWKQVGKKNTSELLAQLKSAGGLNSSDDERNSAARTASSRK